MAFDVSGMDQCAGTATIHSLVLHYRRRDKVYLYLSNLKLYSFCLEIFEPINSSMSLISNNDGSRTSYHRHYDDTFQCSTGCCQVKSQPFMTYVFFRFLTQYHRNTLKLRTVERFSRAIWMIIFVCLALGILRFFEHDTTVYQFCMGKILVDFSEKKT